MKLITLVLGMVVIAVAVMAVAQSTGQKRAFEVVSIKPNHSDNRFSGENTRHGRLTVTNDTLKELIRLAFDVKDFQIEGGPRWLDSDRYDIVATTSSGEDITDQQLRPYV
jgi:uncharacterized protein (TIGR03435 family)